MVGEWVRLQRIIRASADPMHFCEGNAWTEEIVT